MRRLTRGGFEWLDPPAPGKTARGRGLGEFDLGTAVLRVVFEAETGRPTRRVTITNRRTGSATPAGLVQAHLRWTPGDGPPDLTLTWPMHEGATADEALISDVELVARDKVARRAVLAFLDALRPPGRPAGSRDKRRQMLVEEVRTRPRMTDEEIDARGRELKGWGSPLEGDFELIKKRVARVRADANRQ